MWFWLLISVPLELKHFNCSIDIGLNMSAIRFQVWFQGKASCLGLKAGLNEPVNADESSAVNPWCELPLPKGPSIFRCSTGHEGQHAVLIDENGTAYFVGLARRGEDGDFCKFSFEHSLVFYLRSSFLY